MKKISFLIVCALLLVACDKETTNNNTSKGVEDSNLNSQQNIERESNSNTNDKESNSNAKFDYNKDKVGKNNVVLYLFYSSTCPHCHAEIDWLDEVKDKYPYLKVVKKEASDNMDEYELVRKKMDIDSYGVPLTIIGGSYHVGFAESLEDYFDSMIKYYSTFDHCDMVDAIINDKDIDNCKQINKK